MHKFSVVFFGCFLINILSCGVSKQDYEALKAENASLRQELDMFLLGEERTLSRIEQAIQTGNISEAKENLTLLQKYHPEAIGKEEEKRVIALVEKEEARLAKIVAEKEAAEKAARLKRQQGFENVHAADAQVLDVAEADLMKSNKTLTVGSYYIICGYFSFESGGRVHIYSERSRYSDGSYGVDGASVSVNSDQLLKLTEGASISVLVQAFEGHLVINPNSKAQGFSLVEWQR